MLAVLYTSLLFSYSDNLLKKQLLIYVYNELIFTKDYDNNLFNNNTVKFKITCSNYVVSKFLVDYGYKIGREFQFHDKTCNQIVTS